MNAADLMIINEKTQVTSIMNANVRTEKFGLVLSQEDAHQSSTHLLRIQK